MFYKTYVFVKILMINKFLKYGSFHAQVTAPHVLVISFLIGATTISFRYTSFKSEKLRECELCTFTFS